MRKPIFAVLLAVAALLPAARITHGARQRVVTENLLSVTRPVHKEVAQAHPWVNVRVQFGTTSDGLPADPTTFRAKLGRCDVTDLFQDFEQGGVSGKHARLPSDARAKCRFKRGSRPKNRLKFRVRALGAAEKKARRTTDLDRVKFGVAKVANQAPLADFSFEPPLVGATCGNGGGPGDEIDVSFSAQASRDPDGDWLDYEWDFGDGSSGSGANVVHAYTSADPVTVTLRVRDADPEEGGTEVVAQRPIGSELSVDPGRVPGSLRVSTDDPIAALELGAVAIGSSRQTTFLVHNDDPPEAATSQIKFSVGVAGEDLSSGGSQFTVGDCTPSAPCALDAGEMRAVTVTFAPEVAGHAHAALDLEAVAANRCAVQLLAHGYGGSGVGVPWDTPDTVFALAGDLLAVRPDGTRLTVAAGTGVCLGGSLLGAPCFVGGDCPGGGCSSRTCLGGASDATACGSHLDCPGGICGEPFDAVDMCTDGSGSVFLFTDDIHDDPNFDCDPCETGTIIRLGLDGSEAVVTQKVTEQSPALACDRSADGRVYWAHYDLFGVDFDEREQLRSVRKTGSAVQTHVANVNLRLGDVDPENYIDPSDGFVFYEPTTTVRVDRDGDQRFVANFFGLYRLDPSPLLMTRDVDEVFDVDGDGTILTARAVEQTSEVRVYKLNPSIAIHGAVRLDGITPWASTRIPNNGTSCSGGVCTRSIFITSVAGDRDGVVFVNLLTGDSSGVVPPNLRPRGTLRFEPQGDGSSGIAAGFVDLAAVERLDL